MLQVHPAVFYRIADSIDLLNIQKILQEDEEFFALSDLSFHYQGNVYLINVLDTGGIGSVADEYLQERYIQLGGFEVVADEDNEIENLYKMLHDDVDICWIDRSLCILPGEQLSTKFIKYILQQNKRSKRWAYIRWAIWPYTYGDICLHSTWALSSLRIIAIIIGAVVSIGLRILNPVSTIRDVVVMLLAYLLGGIAFCIQVQREEEETSYPLTDVALGFIIGMLGQIVLAVTTPHV